MKLVLLILNLLFLQTKCAKILGVFPASGYSQFILAEVLMQELANRGHQITVISPYSPINVTANYKTIEISDIIAADDKYDLYQLDEENLFTNIMTTYQYGNELTQMTLSHKKVQELLHSDAKFDLVIVEQFFSDALKGFATHFHAPLVLFSSMGVNEWNGHAMRWPLLPSINAVCYTRHTNYMNFFQRVQNLYGTVFDYLYRNWVINPLQKKYLEKYFPRAMDFDEVIHNASLMLLNSHVTTSDYSLLPYNMVEIGGFHVIQNPLDKEIQEYLDSAKDGAILFSLGSNLKSSDLSTEKLQALLNVFGKLKQKILWKFEKDLPIKPNNVLISKWLKQRDILAHPNIQLFITHGGLLSTIEAVFYGIPMIGLPIFADQKMNMARATRNGMAKVVPFRELSEETLRAAVDEVISNVKYQQNARKMSNLMRDAVVRPLDLAMYWIEYVLRHNGFHFDAPALYLTWFQFYMIDCVVFLLCLPLSFFVFLRLFVMSIRKNQSKTIQNKVSAKKNKKKQL